MTGIQLTIEGQILAIKENVFKTKEGKEYKSWRVFLLNSSNNFNPVVSISLDYDYGMAQGFLSQDNLNQFVNKKAKFIASSVNTFEGKLIANFDIFDILK